MSGAPKKLLLSALSVVVALLVVELGLRWLRPDIGRRPFADPDLGWSSREYREFGSEPAPPSDGDKTRLLVLGDSYLAGENLARRNQRFPEVLAGLHPDKYETRILATGGWGTDQELLAYLAKGSAWRPDLVILAFCATNDFANVLSNTQGGASRKPYFVLGKDDSLSLHDATGQPLIRDAAQHAEVRHTSFIVDLIRARFTSRERAHATRGRGVDPRYTVFQGNAEVWADNVYAKKPSLDWSPQDGVNTLSAFVHGDYPITNYGWRLIEALIAKLNGHVEADGARLMCLLLPVTMSPHDLDFSVGSGFEQTYETPTGELTFRIDEPRDRLAGICKRQGVEFFDPSVDFLNIVREQDLIEKCWPNPHNRHFSPVGHRILGTLLSEHLEP